MENNNNYGGLFRGIILDMKEPRKGTAKSGKDWFFGEMIVQSDFDNFPKKIPFEIRRESQWGYLSVGQQVEIKYNLDSNEYQGRHYCKNVAWYVQNLGDAVSAPAATPSSAAQPVTTKAEVDDEDLPF